MKAEARIRTPIVYFNGRFVPLAEANVNILTHALNYGTGVFEGIRGYWDEAAAGSVPGPRGGALRALEAELRHPADRDSAERRRTGGHHRRNCAAATSSAPMSTSGRWPTSASARIGVAADDQNDAFAIVALPFGDYFDSQKGLKAGVVSWRRIEDTAIPGRAKICGAYVNSVLASDEARRNGHDEAIFLTEQGHVAEGATCNIFMVRNGKLYHAACHGQHPGRHHAGERH